MKPRYFLAFVTSLTIVLAGCEAGSPTRQGTPLMTQAVVYSTQATIVSANQETRELTLEVPNKPRDNFFEVYVGEEVGNLSDVRLGDRLTVNYIQAVFVDLFRAGDVDPGIGFAAALGTAAPHESPAGGVAKGVSVVAVIEAIDKENGLVGLRGPDGISKVFKVRNPEKLDDLKVGNKIKTTFARAWVTEITPRSTR